MTTKVPLLPAWFALYGDMNVRFLSKENHIAWEPILATVRWRQDIYERKPLREKTLVDWMCKQYECENDGLHRTGHR